MLEARVWVCEWSRESNGPLRCTCRVTFPAGVAQSFPFRGEGKATTWPSPKGAAICTWSCDQLHGKALSCLSPFSPFFSQHEFTNLVSCTVFTSLGLTCPVRLTGSHAVPPARVLPGSYRAQSDSGVFEVLVTQCIYNLIFSAEVRTSLNEFLRHNKFLLHKYSYLHAG